MSTIDNIIAMARKAGFRTSNAFSPLIVRHSNGSWVDVSEFLERFAALVAAAAQEDIQEQCRIIGMSAERELRHRSVMQQALEVMGLMGADLICDAAHHAKKDRHDSGVPCPIQKRWHEAYSELRQALGEQK